MSTILHRDGQTGPFDAAVLERSLQQAFSEIGVKDEIIVRNVAERVAEEVFTLFLSEETIASTRIQAIVAATLVSFGHPEVATAYERHHGPSAAKQPSVEAIKPSEQTTAPSSASLFAPTLPLSTSSTTATGESYSPRRRRLNEERKAITHKFQVGGQEGYITVGLYDDGQPGEIFLKMSKEGSMLSGLMDCFATSISICLQYGVPVKVMARKFIAVTFEPNGPTENPNIPEADSIIDYVFRWLALRFLSPEDRQAIDAEQRASASLVEGSEAQPAKLAL